MAYEQQNARLIFDTIMGNKSSDEIFAKFEDRFKTTETIPGGIDKSGKLFAETTQETINYAAMLDELSGYLNLDENMNLNNVKLLNASNGKLDSRVGQSNLDFITNLAEKNNAANSILDSLGEKEQSSKKKHSKEMEEKYRKYKEKKEKIIQEQFDSRPGGPGTKTGKKDSLINRLIYSPSDVLDKKIYSGSNARGKLDKAFVTDSTTFTKHASSQALDDVDFLFKADASDDVLEAVYKNVNNKTWQDEYIRSQYDAGAYKKEYGFKAKKASELTEEQMNLLREDVSNKVDKFNNAFETVTLDETATAKGQKYINKSFTPAGARQNYMQRTYFNGIDPNSGDFDKAFTNAINNATTENQAKVLETYRDYARETFNQGKTTKLQGAEEFMMERLSKKEAKQAAKLIGNEMGDAGKALMKGLGNDGIGAASKLKGLKVAGGIAAGMVALWAAGEIWDE